MGSLDAGHLPALLALTAALTSAATFGLSTSLQHRVAGATDSRAHTGARLLARLVRRPSWVIGIGLSVFAFCLHALAITLGALALVQPVVVSGIVFAVLIRAGLDRRLPSRREVTWALVTWAGLASFISVVHSGPAAEPPRHGVALVFSVLALVAAGVLFGLVAGLLKIVTAMAVTAPVQMLLHWPAWIIIDVVVALGFAAAVFSEPLASSPGGLFAEVVGLCAMGLGVRQLARTEELVDRQADERTPVPA